MLSLSSCQVRDIRKILLSACDENLLLGVSRHVIELETLKHLREVSEEECVACGKDNLFYKKFKDLASLEKSFLILLRSDCRPQPVSRGRERITPHTHTHTHTHTHDVLKLFSGCVFSDIVCCLLHIHPEYITTGTLCVCSQLSTRHMQLCKLIEFESLRVCASIGTHTTTQINKRKRTPTPVCVLECCVSLLSQQRFASITTIDLSSIYLGQFILFSQFLSTKLPKLQKLVTRNSKPYGEWIYTPGKFKRLAVLLPFLKVWVCVDARIHTHTHKH
eukprot:GHVR01059077.1.p1 GENE.GHVR01059077.1~~GHVR01059077.1.p1  ORF type:complete len:276 (-),score=92.24 GHVR01059077.1:540-1367(-)